MAIRSHVHFLSAGGETHGQGDGDVSYEQVSETSRDQLKAAMAGLSEELAEISGTMGLEVQ